MSDPYRPITTSRQVEIPKGHRLYTTRRRVAAEYTIPVIGQTMAAFLPGSPYTAHIIVGVYDSPSEDGQLDVTVEHTAVPAGTATTYETVAYIFPPIYPNATAFFPGGSARRPRNVVARITYEFSRNPAAWMSDPTIWDFTTLATGPFEVKSYIAEASGETYTNDDGSSGVVGEFLAANFIAYDTVNDEIVISVPGELYYVVPPSVPSATQYAAYVAAKNELMVSRTVDDWYGDISVRRTAYVRAQ